MSGSIPRVWDLVYVAVDLPDLTVFEGRETLVIRLRSDPAQLKDAAQVAFAAELFNRPYSIAHTGEEPTWAPWAEECWDNLVEGAEWIW